MRIKNLCAIHQLSESVLQSIFFNLATHSCRLWRMWDSKCRQLISWSNKFFPGHLNPNPHLLEDWKNLVNDSQAMWQKLVTGNAVLMEIGNDEDDQEEQILDKETLEGEEHDIHILEDLDNIAPRLVHP